MATTGPPQDPVRAEARRDTRRRFEQWAKNPACQANTVSAVHNVAMARVARLENIPFAFGQSPFALLRGRRFERDLFIEDGRRLLDALAAGGVVAAGATGLLDLRLRPNGGRLQSLDDAIDRTRDFVRGVAAARTQRQRAALPVLVAGATVRIPRRVMLPEAVLILDALVVRSSPDTPELFVGEIKTTRASSSPTRR